MFFFCLFPLPFLNHLCYCKKKKASACIEYKSLPSLDTQKQKNKTKKQQKQSVKEVRGNASMCAGLIKVL